MSQRFTKGALMTGTMMASLLVVAPATAQTADDTAEEAVEEDNLIVVTGSRIQQRNVETAAPIAVVGSEEFELSGTVNVENVVNTLPQVIPGTTSFSNNPGNGTATLNLRGLGTNRTLVLVNGRRWMFFDTSQVVDLNTIPSFLIDSVDVVTGGASAVYGSDALAGVVNFRLKDVEGVELGAQYDITERGDGKAYNLHGAIGTSFDDGRGSATVYAEYFNRSPIFQADRDFSNTVVGLESFGLNQAIFGSSTLPNGVLRYLGGASGAATLPAGTEFGDQGAVGFGTGVVFDDTPGDFRRRAGDTYNYAPANYIQIPQERYLFGGYADYEFSDGHEFYTEVSFVNNRVASELAPSPVTGSFNLDLATVSPFLAAGDFAQLQAIDAQETIDNAAFNLAMVDQDPLTPGVQFTPAVDDPGVVSFFVQRRITETGVRNNLDERNAFRVLGGVRGSITDNLNYDAFYSYARTRNATIQRGNISRSAFQAGLDGTGTTINIFGPDTLTPEMVNAISYDFTQNSDVSTLETAAFALSGFLGDLGFGAGDVGFAAGVEYRGVGSAFVPDDALASGDVIGFNAGGATSGDYNVSEFFAELNIPIIDTDGGQRLELSGAARYSDYSLDSVGGVWTYAGGVEFAPINDVILRAQYQRAIRVPNVGELFGGTSIGFPQATDPCGDPGIVGTPGEAVCIAAGVPAAAVGNPDLQPNGQIPAIFGGNQNLSEETSDSFTAGVVLQPSFVPGLTITADYYDITIENAVATFGGGLNNALDLCFNQVQDINDPVCAPFVGTRSIAGAIVTANPPTLLADNIASLDVSGVDVEVSYRTSLPFSLMTDSGESGLNFNFLGSWTEKNDFTPVQGFDRVITCAGEFGVTCGEPTPEFKWTSRLSWIDGPVTTSLRWRFIDSVKDDDDTVDYAALNGTEVLDSVSYYDLSFSYDVTEQVTLSFGVNNVLDTLPTAPQFEGGFFVSNVDQTQGNLLGDNQEQSNTYPSTYDVLGRRFFASANFKF